MSTPNTAAPSGRILLKNVRLAFPKLFEAVAVNAGDKPQFGATLIIPLDHPQIDEIVSKMDAVGREKWGDKWTTTKKLLEKQDRLALHDGDLKAKYDGFAGNYFISANAKEDTPPTIIDRDRSPLTARSGRPYAGCYVNASLDFWPQKDHPKGGSRINAQLRGVQFFEDGDAFSAGRPADSDEFEDVSEGADADAFA
jgi:acyl-CoA synthetase (AMP-forming)/AMP-acid ligase II